MEFEWDNDKDVLNRAKHGISFDEAKHIFDGPFGVDKWNCTASSLWMSCRSTSYLAIVLPLLPECVVEPQDQ